MLRHERMAVALHLAEALHHSSGALLEPVVERREEEEVQDSYFARTGAAGEGEACGVRALRGAAPRNAVVCE